MTEEVSSSNSLGLHKAVEENDVPQIKKLLSLGFDVNSVDSLKSTPLHDTGIFNRGESHYEAAKLLLENGADVNAKNQFDETPLFPLVKNGNLKMVQLYLNFGPDISVLDNYKRNLLFPAITNPKHLEILKLLIDLGLNVEQVCSISDKRPIHWALDFMDEDFRSLKCLLKNKANINAVDKFDRTILLSAVFKFMKYDNPDNNLQIALLREKMKKLLIFIINYADFNVIHNDFLSSNDEINEEIPEDLWKFLLYHLAIIQSLNIPVHQTFLQAISMSDDYIYYYIQCIDELSNMKNIKIPNSWLTFHSLLVDNKKKLKNYAGIDDFGKNYCVKKFPVYGRAMDENVKKGIKRRELFDRSCILLSECLPIFNSTHLIVTDVLDCIIGKKNLDKFCE